jgi:hypothetical protein
VSGVRDRIASGLLSVVAQLVPSAEYREAYRETLEVGLDERERRLIAPALVPSRPTIFAREAKVDRQRQTVAINGEPFPYYLAEEGPTILHEEDGYAVLNLPLLVERVEVIE